MPRALMLVKTSAKAVGKLADDARKIRGVKDAFPVFGRIDLVVLLEGANFQEITATAVALSKLSGVKATETLPEAP